MKKYYSPSTFGEVTEVEFLGEFESHHEAKKAFPDNEVFSAKDHDVAYVKYFRKRVLAMGIKLKKRTATCSQEHIDRLSVENRDIWERLKKLQSLRHQITLDI